ncbi:MAG: glycosyltransferase [Azospirillaceae bacterium]|nr:glycosyltransferase [Azospirillaceae bacterium]
MILFMMVTTARSTAYTRMALASFLAHTPLGPDDRVILIDNDGAAAPPANGRVELVRNRWPMGFAANVNQVLEWARGSAADLVVLNNDIIFTPGWLPPLLVDDRAILLPMTNQHVEYHVGDVVFPAFLDLDGYLGREGELRAAARQHAATWAEAAVFRPLHLSFHAFRLSHTVLTTLGPFDEHFGPAGGEDGDYRIRAHLAGFDVRCAPTSFVLHFGGRSTWRSGEADSERDAREATMLARFRAKWGDDLTELFLHGPGANAVLSRHGLTEAVAVDNVKKVIETCLMRRCRG